MDSQKVLQGNEEQLKISLRKSENSLNEKSVILEQLIAEFKETADELDRVMNTKEGRDWSGRTKSVKEIVILKEYIARINVDYIK